MATKDALGDRMKDYYENRYRIYATRRTPLIIRLDGKAWHTWTRNFKKPFDSILRKSMDLTMQRLCENIQGCKFGYTQSDEITLVLTDTDTITTDGWFDYNIQKMCSIAASMCTLYFNQIFRTKVNEYFAGKSNNELGPYHTTMCLARDKGAMFDARCFNIPETEVSNMILWRQEDCTRNAIQTLGQCYLSNKELHKKSNDEVQDMLMTRFGINFNDMPIEFKRGTCCYRKPVLIETVNGETVRNKWVIDYEMPIISKNPEFINQFI